MLAIKLSTFYFVYFALLGLMAPYLGLYLESRGFELFEIAQLSSILMFTKVLAPNIWGYVADRYQQRLLLVRIGCLGTLLCYVAFFFAELFWHYALSVGLFSFFWNAVLPQYEVMTLYNLKSQPERYSRIRLWGSLGFILSVVGGGLLFEAYSLALFPLALLIVVLAIALATVPSLAEAKHQRHGAMDEPSFLAQLCRKPIIIFFLVCLLLQLSHGAYYTYFSIYLETFGYSKTEIGFLWGLGVLAEVLLFMVMHTWLLRYSLKQIMLLALTLTSLRWLLIAFYPSSIEIVVLAQGLHAMSFGAMHAVAIHFVGLRFQARNQGRAQALYSSLGFGLGGALGALMSGYIVAVSGYQMAFLVSALCAALAVVLVQLTTFSYR